MYTEVGRLCTNNVVVFDTYHTNSNVFYHFDHVQALLHIIYHGAFASFHKKIFSLIAPTI